MSNPEQPPLIPDPVYWVNQPADGQFLEIVCLGWSAPPAAITQYDPAHTVVAIANPTHTYWVDDIINIANSYDNCRVTAWSLGVVTASRLLGDISNAKWWAVNGVEEPFTTCLDRQTSEVMATQLTSNALTAFQMGMCGSKGALRSWQALTGHPSLAHAQAALAWWIDLVDQPASLPANRWNHITIGTHDRIMSPDAQRAQWATCTLLAPDERPAPHWIPDTLVANWGVN